MEKINQTNNVNQFHIVMQELLKKTIDIRQMLDNEWDSNHEEGWEYIWKDNEGYWWLEDIEPKQENQNLNIIAYKMNKNIGEKLKIILCNELWGKIFSYITNIIINPIFASKLGPNETEYLGLFNIIFEYDIQDLKYTLKIRLRPDSLRLAIQPYSAKIIISYIEFLIIGIKNKNIGYIYNCPYNKYLSIIKFDDHLINIEWNNFVNSTERFYFSKKIFIKELQLIIQSIRNYFCN